MRKLHLLFLVPALLAQPAVSTGGELKLTIRNGLVTLIAEDVPLSLIMAEWARLGQTQIVNGDKVTTPVSLQIVDMPERRAIDILLRPVSGYMVAERQATVAGASVFDRIMILPTSRPPANTGPMNAPPPSFVPRPMPPVQPAEPDEDVDPPMQPGAIPQPGQEIPGSQPVPGQPNPGAPTGPLTAPRPGQLPPPQPQPVPFGTPTKPGGKPGGGGSGGAG